MGIISLSPLYEMGFLLLFLLCINYAQASNLSVSEVAKNSNQQIINSSENEMNEGLYTDAKEMNKQLTANDADAKEMNKNISKELIEDSDMVENMISVNASSEDVIDLDQDLGIDLTILAPNSSILMLSKNTSLDLSDSKLLKKLKTDNSSLVKIFQSLPRKRINRILRLLNNVVGKNRNEIYVIKIIVRLLRDFKICHCRYKVSKALNLRLSRWKYVGIRLKYISVSGNGYHIWGIALNNNIYYRRTNG